MDLLSAVAGRRIRLMSLDSCPGCLHSHTRFGCSWRLNTTRTVELVSQLCGRQLESSRMLIRTFKSYQVVHLCFSGGVIAIVMLCSRQPDLMSMLLNSRMRMVSQ